jgi:hypothetical protein
MVLNFFRRIFRIRVFSTAYKMTKILKFDWLSEK